MPDISWITAKPIAHRGLHGLHPDCVENTLPAFQAAIDKGYAIECDLHPSADGVPMVFHDDSLERLTQDNGAPWEKTADELSKLTIANTNHGIPRLTDLLQLVDGQVPLVIELKGASRNSLRLVRPVLDALATYQGPIALMSFSHGMVRTLARLESPFPIGLTATGHLTLSMESHFSMLAHNLSFVSYSLNDLHNPFVTFVRDRLSFPVITWTIRNSSEATRSMGLADQITFEGFLPENP